MNGSRQVYQMLERLRQQKRKREILNSIVNKKLTTQVKLTAPKLKDLISKEQSQTERNQFRHRKISLNNIRNNPINVKFRPFQAYQQNERTEERVFQQKSLKQILFSSPLISLQRGQQTAESRKNINQFSVRKQGKDVLSYDKQLQLIKQRLLELQHFQNPFQNEPVQTIITSIAPLQSNKEILKKIQRHKQISITQILLSQDQQEIQLENSKNWVRKDFQTLSNWVRQMIQKLSLRKVSTSFLIEALYLIHYSAFEEFLRLNMSEDVQRTILLKNIFISLFSIFNFALVQQHQMALHERSKLRQIQRLKQIQSKKLQEKADIRVARAKEQRKEAIGKSRKLGVVLSSYRDINQQLVYQNQKMRVAFSSLKKDYDHMLTDYMKLVQRLRQQNYLQQTQSSKLFFFSSHDEPVVIREFVTNDSYFQLIKEFNLKQEHYEGRINQYWKTIKQEFITHELISQSQLTPLTRQQSTQTDWIGIRTADVQLQNYSLCSHVSDIIQTPQDKFQFYLTEQMQRKKDLVQQNVQDAMPVSLKVLFEQVYQRNQKLQRQLDQQLKKNRLLTSRLSGTQMELANINKEKDYIGRLLATCKKDLQDIYRDYQSSQKKLQKSEKKLVDLQERYADQSKKLQILKEQEIVYFKKIQKIQTQAEKAKKHFQSEIRNLKIKLNKALKATQVLIQHTEAHPDPRLIDISNKFIGAFPELSKGFFMTAQDDDHQL